MKTHLWMQVCSHVAQGWKAELADKERLLTPFLFALSLLLLFNFAIDVRAPELAKQHFVAALYLTSFLALQLSYGRIFAPEQQDEAFELLQSYRLSASAWFLAKWFLTWLLSCGVFVPVLLLNCLLLPPACAYLGPVLLIGLLALLGLAALGVLLSCLTLRAVGRDLLFPLLYFPLAVPVLLAAVQASLLLMEGAGIREWLTLLCGFDMVFGTLGLLLFGELVGNEA